MKFIAQQSKCLLLWIVRGGFLFVCAFGAIAAEPVPAQTGGQGKQVPALPVPLVTTWAPPAPSQHSEFDWIQLTSDEWLKGELRSLEQKKLEFDSDKLGILTLDWEDVRQVISAKPMSILYGNDSIATGYLATEDGKLVVLGTHVVVPFDQVLGIAKGTPNELDLWTANLSLTLNLRTGNVEQQDFNASMKLRRKTASTTLRLSYLGHYSYYESEENANDHRAAGTFDYRLNSRWFVRPGSLEYYRDPYQNIAHQWTIVSGAGVYVMDNDDITWFATAGPGYQMTRFVETQESQDAEVDSGVVFLSTNYEHEVTNDLDLLGIYQVILSNDASGRARHHAEFSVEVDLTDRLDLMVALYWDRTEKPQPDENGIAPEPDDFQLAVGVSFEL